MKFSTFNKAQGKKLMPIILSSNDFQENHYNRSLGSPRSAESSKKQLHTNALNMERWTLSLLIKGDLLILRVV